MQTTIRKRILKYFLILTTFSILFVSILSIFQISESLRLKTYQDLKKVSESIYIIVNRYMTNALKDVALLAEKSKPAIQTEDHEKIYRQLNIHKALYRNISALYVYNVERKTISGTSFFSNKKFVLNSNAFSNALSGEPGLTNIFLDKQQKHMIYFIIPLKEKNSVTAVFIASYNVKDLEQIVVKFSLGKTGTVLILDQHMEYLFSPVKTDKYYEVEKALKKQLARKKHYLSYLTLDNRYVYGNYFNGEAYGNSQNYIKLPWTVVVIQDRAEVFKPFMLITGVMTTVAVIILILTLLISQKLAKAITIPIVELTKGVDIIGAGNLDYKVDIHTGDELQRLSTSFNNMAKELKHSLEKLIKSERRYRELSDLLPQAVYETDTSGTILFVNRSFYELFEVSQEDLDDGVDITALLSKESRQKFLTDRMLIAENTFVADNEYLMQKKSGTFFPAMIYDSFIPGNDTDMPDAYRGIIVDISARKKIEEGMLQVQKMEIVGSLAGGLAHDFNNMLQGIRGSVSLLKMLHKFNRKRFVDEAYDNLETIDSAAKRAADTVVQLLALSRNNDLVLKPVDINESVLHILKIGKNTFDKNIKIEAEFYPEQAMVMADPTQIEQVLLNLCMNAVHAMTIMRGKNEKQGGELTISVKFLEDIENLCLFDNNYEGDYYAVSIKDNGVGIDTFSVHSIFEPFFTRGKGVHGTGLGLATAYNIIRNHHGFIDVCSEKGKGANFTIYLPAVEENKIISEENDEEALTQSEGTILIVDDEEIIRESTSRMLHECGYDILLADNGEKGVEVFKKHRDEISLVILDLVMPDMNGRDCFFELRKIDKNVRVLLVSGYTDDWRVQEVIEGGVNGFLQKPYTVRILEQKISEIL